MSIKHDYPPFATWEWKNYDGDRKVDVAEFIKNNLDADFFIGTDSQNYRKNKKVCCFTTVLVAYRKGRGGTIIIHSDKTPFIEQARLRQRLLLEAMRSLETAWFVDSLINKQSVVTIHLDVNDSLRHKSGQYKDELVGLVMGQGFNAAWKPNGWASSNVADSRV